MEKKNVLVITGSPRKNGNSDILAEAFIEGAEKAGHTVNRFNAGRKKIKGCMACNKCFSKGTACVFNDDFNEVAPLIEQADTIVFASPLYFFSFTTQIKALTDKFYSFHIGNRPLKIKESILLACGETTDMADFEGMIKTYELIANYMQWKDRGQIIVSDVNNKGEINEKAQAYLQEARELGEFGIL